METPVYAVITNTDRRMNHMERFTMGYGNSPTDAPCVQTIDPNYNQVAYKEVQRYRKLLLDTCGHPPHGGNLVIHCEKHDFGMYYEVQYHYNPDDKEEIDYAFYVEANMPKMWGE